MSREPYASDPATYPAQAFAALLGRLPTSVRDVQPLARNVVTEVLLRAFPFDEAGVGKVRRTPDRYWFKIAGRRPSMAAWAASAIMDGDERASALVVRSVFWEPDSTTPQATRWASVGLRLGWARAMSCVRALVLDRLVHELALLSDDDGYGFVLDSHVGYVPYELSDEETVYRVARWCPFD